MKGSRDLLRHDLFSLNVVCDITLERSAPLPKIKDTSKFTKSLAPLFKNLAPAKNLERRAMIVI